MSPKESEFLIALKKWSLSVMIVLTGAIISGCIFMYKQSVQTAVKVEYIQADMRDMKADIKDLRTYYLNAKK